MPRSHRKVIDCDSDQCDEHASKLDWTFGRAFQLLSAKGRCWLVAAEFFRGRCMPVPLSPTGTAIRPAPICNFVKSAWVRCRAPQGGRMVDPVDETEQFCSD